MGKCIENAKKEGGHEGDLAKHIKAMFREAKKVGKEAELKIVIEEIFHDADFSKTIEQNVAKELDDDDEEPQEGRPSWDEILENIKLAKEAGKLGELKIMLEEAIANGDKQKEEEA